MKSDQINAVVQEQLDAYNSRDIEKLMGQYHPDAKQFEFPSTLLADGSTEIRGRFLERFKETNLYAKLIQRVVQGRFVIDHEEVTRTFPEGPGTIGLTAIYEVQSDKIRNAWFLYGEKKVAASR